MKKSSAFACFAALQVLDVATTLLFLYQGVAEANPLMRAALTVVHRPLLALALPKVGALALALYASRSGRGRLLTRINMLFGCCVAWNLAAIAVV
jgi:Domain of unknown function (DUF5658)